MDISPDTEGPSQAGNSGFLGSREMGGPGSSALDNHEGDLRRDSVQSGGRDLEVISPDNLEYRVLFFISIFETIVYI